METYEITGENYSGKFKGEENFLKVGRTILLDNGSKTGDLFGIKTAEQMIAALSEKKFNVTVELSSSFDEAADENQVAKEPDIAGMEISKIKIKKDEKFCEILYYKNGNHSSKEVKFNGYEAVLDEFIMNFREMSKYVVEVLSFPEEWLSRITTTGLSITWKEGSIMGMVITSQMELTGLNCPLNLNTPFIEIFSWAVNNDSCNDVCFSKDCEDLLEEIISNAKAYMLGETATKQQSLFEG